MKEVRSPWSSGGNPVHSAKRGIRSSTPGRADQGDLPAPPIHGRTEHGEEPAGPQGRRPDSTPQGEPQEHETATDRSPHED
jgi:hypothetical protein